MTAFREAACFAWLAAERIAITNRVMKVEKNLLADCKERLWKIKLLLLVCLSIQRLTFQVFCDIMNKYENCKIMQIHLKGTTAMSAESLCCIFVKHETTDIRTQADNYCGKNKLR